MADAGTGMQRSSRDLDDLRRRLERWMAGRLGPAADPQVSELQTTSANGMSSETILFSASWEEGGRRRAEDLVARIAPDPADVPVFPSYDLGEQFRAMRTVAERSDVPVPVTHWSEPSGEALGAPFFVMGRVDGDVPPDVMPYNFGDSWLFEASPGDQRLLQEETVALLARLHAIADPEEHFAFLDGPGPGTRLRRHLERSRAWYEFAAADGLRSPLVEAGFDWLDAHWPADEGPAVLSWGDARIGNVMYRGFRPVAVLDWEMVALGPAELDLAWLIYAHRVFEDIAATYGFPGMPGFLRREDVVATYEDRRGTGIGDLDWHVTYCAVRWGIIGMRTAARQAHFGERELPDDGDELVLNREGLERLLAGTYWAAASPGAGNRRSEDALP